MTLSEMQKIAPKGMKNKPVEQIPTPEPQTSPETIFEPQATSETPTEAPIIDPTVKLADLPIVEIEKPTFWQQIANAIQIFFKI